MSIIQNTKLGKLNIRGTLRSYFLLLALPFLLLGCGTSKEVVDKQPDDRKEFKVNFHEGIREKMIGNYDIAIRHFEKCLLLEPQNSAVHFALSNIYEEQGDHTKAIQFAEQAHELDVDNKWYILKLADLYFNLGHYHKSANYFGMVVNEEEENTDLKFQYTRALIYSNQNEKAIEVMDDIEIETGKIPELSLTKHDLYLKLGDEEKAQQEIDDLIADNPGNTENRMAVASYFIQTGQVEKAEQMANEVIEIDPENGEAHIILADLNLRKGDINKAFDHLNKGLGDDNVEMERKLELIWSLVPYAFEAEGQEAEKFEKGIEELFKIIYDEQLQNDLLHSYYGIFLRKQGKLEESRDQFVIVCELNPSSYNARLQLLNVLYDLNDFNGMVEEGKKAIELFPAQPMFYLLTGIGSYESGDYSGAEEWLYLGKDLVIKDDELSAEFLYHLGKNSCLQKNYEEGYQYFEQSKSKYKNDGRAFSAKALCYKDEGRLDEALAEIKAGLDIHPINPLLLDTYGILLMEKENYSLASEKFQKALMNDPGNFKILEHYGDALFLSGKKAEAVEKWKESQEEGNTSEVLKRKIADQKYYEE